MPKRLAVSCAASLWIAACSGSSSQGDLSASALVTVDAGEAVTFTAGRDGLPAGTLAWRIAGGGGTLSTGTGESVTFTAPVGASQSVTRIQASLPGGATTTFSVSVRGVELALALDGSTPDMAGGAVVRIQSSLQHLAPTVQPRLTWTVSGLGADASLAVESDTRSATLTMPLLPADAHGEVQAALTGSDGASLVTTALPVTVSGVRISTSAAGSRTALSSGEKVTLTGAVSGLDASLQAGLEWTGSTAGGDLLPAGTLVKTGPLTAEFTAPIVAATTRYLVSARLAVAGRSPGPGQQVDGQVELTSAGVAVQVRAASGRVALSPGESATLSASTSGLASTIAPRFAWSAARASDGAALPGAISSSGDASATFTAPAASDPSGYVVTARLSANATVAGSLVLSGSGVDLAVTAAGGKTTLVSGDSARLVATVPGYAGAPHVTWTAALSTGGDATSLLAVSADSLQATFTAPADHAARSYVVTARLDAPAAGLTRQTVVTTVAGDLLVNEVGNALYYDLPAWLEVRNPTSASVNLGLYTLRARGVSPLNGTGPASTTFPLPTLEVAPGAYLVLAGKPGAESLDGPGAVHLVNGAGLVPFWSDSGFVELLKGGATVDYVRFGASTEPPTTAAAWPDLDPAHNAPALPLDAYGKSIARSAASADTDRGADFSSIDFSTPGGPNDVPPGARDDDGDGIPDTSEVAGGTFAGIDLYAMGARAGQRDLFVEIDHMDSTDLGMVPQRDALDHVVAAFAAHGIHVHLDAGPLFSSSFSPAAYNLGQTDATVPYAPCVRLGTVQGCAGDLYATKAGHMEVRRQAVFHYALFGSSQNLDGSSGSSGVSEIVGNDLLVTLGQWGLDRQSTVAANRLVNFQAATLMHELGHNLGLRHGGDEELNFKPNYLSVMNYMYQLYGLPDVATATEGDRYAWSRFRSVDWCTGLAHGPCDSPSTFVIDFSNGAGAVLDENQIQERRGLGRPTSAGVDFDGNGQYASSTIAFDVNGDGAGDGTLGVLHDFDDWSHVTLPFQRAVSGQSGAAKPVRNALVVSSSRVLSPANDDRQEVSDEPAPPPALFEGLRSKR